MNFCIILLSLFINSFQHPPAKHPPDYVRTCARVYQHLDEQTKKDLPKLLGNHSLEFFAANMGKAARDSIYKYTNPLAKLRLGGPFDLKQFDSVLRPHHLDILNGFKRFERRLLNQELPLQDRLFALQVLIGLNTALQLPLNVTHLLPKNNWNHRQRSIFIFDSSQYNSDEAAYVTVRLYDAYKLGVRVFQASTNKSMAESFVQKGYDAAGYRVAGELEQAILPKRPFEMRVDGPHMGINIGPGNDTVYAWQYLYHPTFPGGTLGFNNFLREHINYPAEEWNNGIEGTCHFFFWVEKDGSISHISAGSVTPAIDSEVVRVVRLSPKWQPAHVKKNGPPVKSEESGSFVFMITPGTKRKDAFKVPLYSIWNNSANQVH